MKTIAIIVMIWASPVLAQAIDRDMTMIEPTTTAANLPIQNLQDCIVDVVDASQAADQRIIPASALTGGGTHTIDLTGKIGLTTVTAKCRNTIGVTGVSVSKTRTFPGDPPSSPTLRD